MESVLRYIPLEYIYFTYSFIVGRDGSVGIATSYGVDGPGTESRGERLSAPVQTGTGAHPASYTMGTGFLSWGQSGRGVALTTHPQLAPRLKKE